MKKLFSRIRQKWRVWHERIPRKTKVAFYALSILILAFHLYIFIGSPALSWQHRYRRIEKAHMIGPGEILGYEEVSGAIYKETVLAKTADAVIITVMAPEELDHELLVYLPRRGKVTVSAAPQLVVPMEFDFSEDTITVFVVDEYPEAVRVELDLVLYWLNADEEIVRPEFSLSAQRIKDGYFRMDIPFETWGDTAPEYHALDQFCRVTRNSKLFTIPENEYSATVRFYDSNDQLIAEEQLYLFE